MQRTVALEGCGNAERVREAFDIWRLCVATTAAQRARAQQLDVRRKFIAYAKVFCAWQRFVCRGQRETLSRIHVGALRQRAQLRSWRLALRVARAARLALARLCCVVFWAWRHECLQSTAGTQRPRGVPERQAAATVMGKLRSSLAAVLHAWLAAADRRFHARRGYFRVQARRSSAAILEWATLATVSVARKAYSKKAAADAVATWRGRVLARKQSARESRRAIFHGNQRVALYVLQAWSQKVKEYKTECLQVQAAHARIIALCRHSAICRWRCVTVHRARHAGRISGLRSARARTMKQRGVQAWETFRQHASKRRALQERATVAWASRWGVAALRLWSQQSRWQHTMRLRIEAAARAEDGTLGVPAISLIKFNVAAAAPAAEHTDAEAEAVPLYHQALIEAFNVRLRTMRIRQAVQALSAWRCARQARMASRDLICSKQLSWQGRAAQKTTRRVILAWQAYGRSTSLRLEAFEVSQWCHQAHRTLNAWLSYAVFREKKRHTELLQAITLARKVSLRRLEGFARWRRRVVIAEDALARRHLHESIAKWWAFAARGQQRRDFLDEYREKRARNTAQRALQHIFEQAQLRKRMKMLVLAADQCAKCFAYQVAAAALRAWRWHVSQGWEESDVAIGGFERFVERRAREAVTHWWQRAALRRRYRWLSRAALLQWMEKILTLAVRAWREACREQSGVRNLGQEKLQRDAAFLLATGFTAMLRYAARRLRNRACAQQVELHVEVLGVKAAISFWHDWTRCHRHRRKQAACDAHKESENLVDDILLSDFITPGRPEGGATIFSAGQSGGSPDCCESIRLGGSNLNEAFEQVAIDEAILAPGPVMPQTFCLTPTADPNPDDSDTPSQDRQHGALGVVRELAAEYEDDTVVQQNEGANEDVHGAVAKKVTRFAIPMMPCMI